MKNKIITILISLMILNIICFANSSNEVQSQTYTYSYAQDEITYTPNNKKINILVKFMGSQMTVESLLAQINNIEYTISPQPTANTYTWSSQQDYKLWQYLFGENQLSQEGFIKLRNSPYSLVQKHFTPDYIMIVYSNWHSVPNGYPYKSEEYILVKLYDVSNHIGQLVFADHCTRIDPDTYQHRNDFGNIPTFLNKTINNLRLGG